MHAAVRHLVRASAAYDPEWGVPVNQEDLAGTLLTFSVVVLDALAKLGTTFSDEDADAYFHSWNCVGHVLGVDRRLICDTLDGRPRAVASGSSSATGRRARRAAR